MAFLFVLFKTLHPSWEIEPLLVLTFIGEGTFSKVCEGQDLQVHPFQIVVLLIEVGRGEYFEKDNGAEIEEMLKKSVITMDDFIWRLPSYPLRQAEKEVKMVGKRVE
ncbi:hypothetical protein DITRI_Ditri09bG0131800 [Diplodiscus trichospermus]